MSPMVNLPNNHKPLKLVHLTDKKVIVYCYNFIVTTIRKLNHSLVREKGPFSSWISEEPPFSAIIHGKKAEFNQNQGKLFWGTARNPEFGDYNLIWRATKGINYASWAIV